MTKKENLIMQALAISNRILSLLPKEALELLLHTQRVKEEETAAQEMKADRLKELMKTQLVKMCRLRESYKRNLHQLG